MAVIGFIINIVVGLIYPSFQDIYNDTTIFIPMTSAQSILFWIYPIVLGIALAWLWTMLKTTPVKFASIYFFIGAVPAFFINVGSFNLPVMMIFSWTVMSYLNGLVAGLIFSKMLK
jgi:hypothetical protein